MATTSEHLVASDKIEEGEATLSEDLNCPLCLKVFKSPRRLPCLHSFCQDCLQSHISNTTSVKGYVKQFCCPICGNVACSGEFSTDKLVHVFPLNTLILSVLMDSRPKVKVDLVCNTCQTEDVISPAEDLCITCEEALCVQCLKIHRRERLSSTHTILKIEDLPNKQKTDLQNNVMFQCTEHACFPVELYCKGHETQLCARCFIVSHKNCSEVIDLTNDPLNLSDSLDQMKEQMQKIEDQLKTIISKNVSNLSKLQSEVNGVTNEIRILKKTINDALDDLENRVKEESYKIVNKEKKRIEQLNHCCQSHITAIRNSNVVVESASKYATQTQMFLLTKKLINQFSMTKLHNDDKYSKNDILKLQLEVNQQLQSITKIPRGEIGILKMKRNDEIPVVPDGFKPLKECITELVNITDIKGLKDKTPWYTKVTFTKNKQLLLVDNHNDLLYLMDSSCNIICRHAFPCDPWDVCLIGEEVVAVTLPFKKSVHILSLKDKSITYVKQIQTKDKCDSVATYNQEELVVSGSCGENKYYWSIITLEGKKKSYHEFDGKGTHQTYVAFNAFKTRLYISVYMTGSLHCFGLDGMKHFTFTHHDLKGPQGVSVDRDDNVYVVGCLSHNIFQLSPDGFLIQVIRTGKDPMGICFDQNGDTFALTHLHVTTVSFHRLVNALTHMEDNSVSFYRHADEDGCHSEINLYM